MLFLYLWRKKDFESKHNYINFRRIPTRGYIPCISLSVTSACARSNSPARILYAYFCPNRHTPFIPHTRAVAIFPIAQSLCLPFSLLRHLWHVSLNPNFFGFFLEYWKGRWKQHQSSDRHIQVPTGHFWGCVGGFTMPPAYRVKVHNCAWRF